MRLTISIITIIIDVKKLYIVMSDHDSQMMGACLHAYSITFYKIGSDSFQLTVTLLHLQHDTNAYIIQ